jgi:hypothetical protein
MELIAIHRASPTKRARKVHISQQAPVKPLCGGGRGAASQTCWDPDFMEPFEAASCVRCLKLATALLGKEENETAAA